MRLATWNVNSIRARVDRVTNWLERADVDVLAMQETKCADDQFPTMPFAAIGYEVVHCGFNQWNGVAIASRVGVRRCAGRLRRTAHIQCQARRRRRPPKRERWEPICAGVQVWSLYVPNGRVPDSPHYHYKLEWLAALKDTARSWLAGDPDAQIALVGDWNIAPTDEDVWSVEFYQNSTHVTPPERRAFREILDAGFADVVRPFTPGPGVYTYWDYTQLRFPKRQGMRIDFILGSPALAERVTHAEIVREERKGKAPSDHAPVLVELAER